MKKLLLIIKLTIVLFCYGQTPKKVLFIGNSMTYFNDMPVLFESIANEKGKNVDVDFYAPGGTGFVNHHVDNNVYNLFQNNVWDMVVLQPGTAESAGVSWPVNTTSERGNKMQDSIKKYSPCAKIFLYEIPYGVPSETNYANYFQVQTMIKDSITKLADNMHVPMVAAGECARQHYTSQQDLLLHSSYNDVHPNLNGSYLVACAMFCTIFQEPVSGVVFNGGVTSSNATYFQGIADNVVLNNKPLWRINTFNLHSEFSLIQNGNQVNFTNLSANYTSLLWDFGDGTTSTEANPNHIFNSTGSKTVTLTVYKNGCSESFVKTIEITTLSISQFSLSRNDVFYDSFTHTLTIKGNQNETYSLYSILGQNVLNFTKQNLIHQINIDDFSKGIYFLKSKTINYKFIKN